MTEASSAALAYLEGPAEGMPGVGAKRARLLQALGIVSVRDLLYHFPRHYLDLRAITPIAEAVPGEVATIRGEIVAARNVQLRGRRNMALVTLRDSSGEMKASFFGRGYMVNSTFRLGSKGIFTGMVGEYKGLTLKSPEFEIESSEAEAPLPGLMPVYPLTEGLTQRMLRQWIGRALEGLPQGLPDTLPVQLRNPLALPALEVALRHIHLPPCPEDAERARKRFIYEELLVLQLRVLRERYQRHDEGGAIAHTLNGPIMTALGKSLPFQLTEAQEKAIAAILQDMTLERPMGRLLQGDVGCGKTVVALHAIAAAIDSGAQVAFMAPTEVLAEQHFMHLWKLLMPLGVQVEFLTGSTRVARTVRQLIASGQSQVVVGTHALIQESTVFKRLGLVIIDEQHRFGIAQRQQLAEKSGVAPHILQMTATPIPRTLAITLYGGLELTIIDALPPGRVPIKTRRVPAHKIPDLYQYLGREAAEGRQSYVICPLIEESETRPLRSVIEHFEALSAGPLNGVSTALLHGRMSGEEKEAVMRSFKAGDISILFSTTVIEVGIDVPSAVNMVIEDAHQFGLTQLHQLRGRVGRGAAQSYCFLVGEPSTDEGRQRLEIICRCADGFELAEEDLKMRGPGEFYGARQSGISDLRAADLLRDLRVLERARKDAAALLVRDGTLQAPENQALRRLVERQAGLQA